jgi:hypothetical protein
MVNRALAVAGGLVAAVGTGASAQDWTPNGPNLFFTGGNVSIGTTNPAHRLFVVSSGTQTAVVGSNAAQAVVAIGVQGQSSSINGRGVYGFATSQVGAAYGGLFRTLSNSGIGVFAIADAAGGPTIGVRGQSASTAGTGVWGVAAAGTGDNAGVRGQAFSTAGTGVLGTALAATGETNGVFGESVSVSGAGVFGLATSNTGPNFGVYGETVSLAQGFGVFSVGNFGASGTKQFQIDHPLDPANKLLNHFSAEGPEPYLVYRGTVNLDGRGMATVELPEYFGEINRDPHYQLTPIGAPAVLYIAQEVVDNRFVIAGGQPGMKVSWTVTGIRNDAFVRRYGAAREQVKGQQQRGRYLHPELYGQPESKALRSAPSAETATPE